MTKALQAVRVIRASSYFATTIHNLIIYWMMYFFIMPVFLSIEIHLIKNIADRLDWSTGNEWTIIESTLWLIFGLQILLGLVGRPHWRLGISGREWLIFSMIIFSLVLFYPYSLLGNFDLEDLKILLETPLDSGKPNSYTSNFIALWLFGTGIIILVSTYVSTRIRHLIRILLFLVAISLIFYILGNKLSTDLARVFLLTNSIWAFNVFCIVSYTLIHSSFYVLQDRSYSIYNINIVNVIAEPTAVLPRMLFWFVALAIVLGEWRSGTDLLESIKALVLILAAQIVTLNPQGVWHHVTNRFRLMWSLVRKDELYDISSPRIGPTNFINYIRRRWWPKYMHINNRGLVITFCLLIGSIFVPLWSARIEPTMSLISRFWLGIFSSLGLIGIYLTYSLIRNRSRYIISQFEVFNVENKDLWELKAIANLFTHLIVEELQQISILITTRQVENLNLSGRDSNAFFVTAGFSQDFVNSMQAVVNIETSSSLGTARVSLTSILSAITRFLARIRVSGKLMARENGTIDVWAELGYSNSQSAVNISIIPENHFSELDENALRPYVRELALKLVVELGQLPHIGTNWKSLDYFLIGLKASVQRNWWEAEYYYRKAIYIEETYNERFGVGHYHLGAALIFQGNSREGFVHLLKAEIDGPQMAETQYMIALVLLSAYWSELHRHPAVFHEINRRCELAADLRTNFPEVFHLWGIAHYRLARLLDREESYGWDRPPTGTKQFTRYTTSWYYNRALRRLKIALRQFDKRRLKAPVSPNFYNQAEMETNSALKQRISIAHSIGDTLRSLRRYAEAETYYEDVLAMFPRERQTLTDLAQLYYLSKNWQRGEEFIWREVFAHPLMRWDPHPNLYMGSIILGGIHSGLVPYFRQRVDTLILRMIDQEVGTYENKTEEKNGAFKHGKAIGFLDFAILMRPRFIRYWTNTNWAQHMFRKPKEFSQSWPFFSLKLRNGSNLKTMLVLTSDNNDNKFHYEIEYGVIWMNYRIYMLHVLDNNESKDGAAIIKELLSSSSKPLYELVFKLREARQQCVKFYRSLEKNDNNQFLEAYDIHGQLVRFADFARSSIDGVLSLYHSMLDEVLQAKQGQRKFTLYSRVVADFHNEFMLHISRLLAETNDFEGLATLLQDVTAGIVVWEELWQKSAFVKGSNDYYTFSPYVGEFQRASLLAWYALALYMTDVKKHKIKIQEQVSAALQRVSTHPIALLVTAWLLRDHGEYERAIDIYKQILDNITPYLPHLSIDLFYDHPGERGSDSHRQALYYMERIAGSLQFQSFTNMWRIHAEMADTFFEMSRIDESTFHWAEAVRWSPHSDIDLKLLLKLSEVFIDSEHYEQAIATVKSANNATVLLRYERNEMVEQDY